MIFARNASSLAADPSSMGWVPSAFAAFLGLGLFVACIVALVYCAIVAGKEADATLVEKRPALMRLRCRECKELLSAYEPGETVRCSCGATSASAAGIQSQGWVDPRWDDTP